MSHHGSTRFLASSAAVALVSVVVIPFLSAAPAGKDKNPAGKVYVAEVRGSAFIQAGDRIEPLEAKQAYVAGGVALSTKPGGNVSLVFSNGLGATLESDTRVEVRRFAQDPFLPDRSDMSVEPSISNVQLTVVYGTAVVSTSRLAAGSSLNVQTAHGSVTIHDGTLVIAADDFATRVSVLTGSCTIHGSESANDFRVVQAGEAATARLAAGQSILGVAIEVAKIPVAQFGALEAEVADTLSAKRTVYFTVRENGAATSRADSAARSGGAASDRFANESGGDGNSGSPGVTAFDSNATNSQASGGANSEIVPVAVVPVDLPVQFTISPARIVRPNAGG